MGAVRDFVDTFRTGPTKPGIWGDAERYGRFEGTGEVSAQVELPQGPVLVSVEDLVEVETLGFELTGPDGEPVEIRRWTSDDVDTSKGVAHRLVRIGAGEVSRPGLHGLRVSAPSKEQALIVVVGEPLTAKGALTDMAEEMIPGRRLWKRLRGEG